MERFKESYDFGAASSHEVSKATGIPKSSVQCILWRGFGLYHYRSHYRSATWRKAGRPCILCFRKKVIRIFGVQMNYISLSRDIVTRLYSIIWDLKGRNKLFETEYMTHCDRVRFGYSANYRLTPYYFLLRQWLVTTTVKCWIANIHTVRFQKSEARTKRNQPFFNKMEPRQISRDAEDYLSFVLP